MKTINFNLKKKKYNSEPIQNKRLEIKRYSVNSKPTYYYVKKNKL